MTAILRREPAHRDRSDWSYQHVTTPRDSWLTDERRRIRYLVDNMLIGDEIRLPDGRQVYREYKNAYHVYACYALLTTCTASEIMPYLLTNAAPAVPPPVVETPAPRPKRAKREQFPPRKSRYRCVIFDRQTGTWYACVGWQTRSYKLPHRRTEAEAARDYDNFLIEHGITDRPFNFPLEDAA